MEKRSDLDIISLWMLIAVITVIFPQLQSIGLGILFGMPVIFFIPGYVLIAALFPKKDDLRIVDRIALSIGTSIAVIILLGLLLSSFFEITSIPIVTIIVVYTAILIIITRHIRKRLYEKLPQDAIFSVNIDKGDILNYLRPKDNPTLNIIIVIFLIFAIGASYYTITTPKIGERFTEFYILDENGTGKYPVNLSSPVPILIGIANHENVPINYTIQTVLDRTVLSSESLILKNEEVWEKNVTLPSIPAQNKENAELKFLLFKNDNLTTPYRSLHLWVSS